ncbi:methyltransferase [Salinispirillum sp. LH 10-3-1]|uniref:tRNA1(Val) (adenine(37)-N6)-methyltransferase n=1 Tax=Salinispirillum sp. LH 10-3-1 TaxID=2952525 RepID=A0AB38YE61_9GAMM
MKVGTDALLLGSWAALPNTGAILDIGAGSGILSLMLAQRSDGALPITALEIDPDAATQATENVAESPWADTIGVVHADALQWQPASLFSLIISNPPFFTDSLGSPKASRHRARHTDSLPFAALLDRVVRWLAPDGQFSLILPVISAQHVIVLAESLGWFVQRCCMVQPAPHKVAHRWLLSLTRQACATEKSSMVIKDQSGDYSPEYRHLTQAFYLRF